MTDSMSNISALSLPRRRRAVSPYLWLRHSLLVALLFSVTVLAPVWIGPAPLWLIITALAVAFAMVDRTLANDLALVTRALSDPIAVPWLCAVVAFSVIDAVRATGDFERIALLNLFELATMLVAAALACRTPPHIVIYAVALFAAGEGLLCIGQILQIHVAWRVPDLISNISSHVKADASEGTADIGAVFRVRGTFQFIHKFNVMQGMLAAFLLCMVFDGALVIDELRFKYVPVAICTAFGLIGVLLTFSRSTWIGLGLTFLYLMYRSRFRIGTGRILTAVAGFAILLYLLDFTSLPALARLTDFSSGSPTNSLRLSQGDYALGVLASSPLYGQPIPYHTGDYPVHSVALRKFVDYGLLGFLPYLFTILGIGLTLLKFARSRNIAASAIGQAALTVLAVAMIDSSSHSAGILHTDVTEGPFILILIGLMMGLAPAIMGAPPRRRRRGPPAIAADAPSAAEQPSR